MGMHNNKEQMEYIKRRRKKKAKQHTNDRGEFQMPHSNEIHKRFCSDATPVPSKIKPQVKVVLKLTPCTWVILNFAKLKDVV